MKTHPNGEGKEANFEKMVIKYSDSEFDSEKVEDR
jgi:hypothetical protein